MNDKLTVPPNRLKGDEPCDVLYFNEVDVNAFLSLCLLTAPFTPPKCHLSLLGLNRELVKPASKTPP